MAKEEKLGVLECSDFAMPDLSLREQSVHLRSENRIAWEVWNSRDEGPFRNLQVFEIVFIVPSFFLGQTIVSSFCFHTLDHVHQEIIRGSWAGFHRILIQKENVKWVNLSEPGRLSDPV